MFLYLILTKVFLPWNLLKILSQSKCPHKKFQVRKIISFIPHRPDLLDWRQVERREVRERIDLAFHVMDREYGVTRLLDPEGESTNHSVSPSDPFLIYLKSWRDQYIGKDLLEEGEWGAARGQLLFQRHLFHLCHLTCSLPQGTPGCLQPPPNKTRRLAQMTTCPDPQLSVSLSDATLLHLDFFPSARCWGKSAPCVRPPPGRPAAGKADVRRADPRRHPCLKHNPLPSSAPHICKT